MNHRTEPNEATKRADEAGVGDGHSADRPATEQEAAAAKEQYDKGDAERRADVARHEEEMMEIGAATKGEGTLD